MRLHLPSILALAATVAAHYRITLDVDLSVTVEADLQ